MNVFNFNYIEALMFLLVFIRVISIIVWIPLFDEYNNLAYFKILFSFILALILFPIVKTEIIIPSDISLIGFLILAFYEVTLGMLIGLISKIIFYAVELAGQIISYQMGFLFANIFDFSLGERVNLLSRFYYILAMLIFLVFNGHHILISALFQSFQIVKFNSINFSNNVVEQLIQISGDVFLISFKITVPVIVALLLTNMAFGFLSRLMPQVNIFIVSLPVLSIIGFFFLFLSLPFCADVLHQEVSKLYVNIINALKVI